MARTTDDERFGDEMSWDEKVRVPNDPVRKFLRTRWSVTEMT